MIGRLGCSLDPDILGSFPTGSSLDYLIHSFGRWSLVFVVYSPGVGPKGRALVRFHVKKKKRRGQGYAIDNGCF